MPSKKPKPAVDDKCGKLPPANIFDAIPDAPATAGGVEYAAVPSERLLFAVYDAEKQQRNHTDAVYELTDEVKQLHVEVENLADNVSKLEDVIKELKDTFGELRDALQKDD